MDRKTLDEYDPGLTADGFPRCEIIGYPCCCRGCKMRRQAVETQALIALQLVHGGRP